MNKFAVGFVLIIFLLVYSLGPKGQLSWDKLAQLYKYTGEKPSKCWKDQLIAFIEISSDNGAGAGSSADRNYELCFVKEGFFLKQDTIGDELNPGILIPWSELKIRIGDDNFIFRFYPEGVLGTRFEVRPGDLKICREMRSELEKFAMKRVVDVYVEAFKKAC